MPLPHLGSDPLGWISLNLIPNLGSEGALALLKAFSVPANVFAQDEAFLVRVVGRKRAQAVRAGADPNRLNATRKWLESETNHLLTLADADYPRALLQIPDPPVVLSSGAGTGHLREFKTQKNSHRRCQMAG
jgi:DNA processing protein